MHVHTHTHNEGNVPSYEAMMLCAIVHQKIMGSTIHLVAPVCCSLT